MSNEVRLQYEPPGGVVNTDEIKIREDYSRILLNTENSVLIYRYTGSRVSERLRIYAVGQLWGGVIYLLGIGRIWSKE